MNIMLSQIIEAGIIRVLDHLDIGNESLRKQMRTLGVQEAFRACRQVPPAEAEALKKMDPMGGLRGVALDESRMLVEQCIAEAGLSDELESISSRGWNLLYRVVDKASKRGALEREKHLTRLGLAPKGEAAQFVEWMNRRPPWAPAALADLLAEFHARGEGEGS